jgi:hypothetical protein
LLVAPTEPSPPPAARVSVRDQTRNEPVASTARDIFPRHADEGVRREPQPSLTPPADATHAAPPTPPPDMAAPADHARIASSHERIVRAALDWVAADPMSLTIPPPVAPASPQPSPPVAPIRAERPAAPQTRDDRVPPDPATEMRPQARRAVGQLTPAPPLAPGESPSVTLTARRQNRTPIEPAVAVERPAPREIADQRPRHQDEVVEVSIGAIHVHVDAPAPRAAAAAPPAPRMPLSATRPARDGLRRRALRRI